MFKYFKMATYSNFILKTPAKIKEDKFNAKRLFNKKFTAVYVFTAR